MRNALDIEENKPAKGDMDVGSRKVGFVPLLYIKLIARAYEHRLILFLRIKLTRSNFPLRFG